MSNPPRNSQSMRVYRVDCSGHHLTTGNAIDANTLTLFADRADASKYAQRTGRSHRQSRSCDAAQEYDRSTIASTQRSEESAGHQFDQE